MFEAPRLRPFEPITAALRVWAAAGHRRSESATEGEEACLPATVLVADDDLLELGDDLAERSRELVAGSFRWRQLSPAAT